MFIAPGLTALTRIWRSNSSRDPVRASERTAALDAESADRPAVPTSASHEVLRMIDPPSRTSRSDAYPAGSAPEQLEALASKIRSAAAFVFVTGEYNWGVQPALKNLTDHFLEEWFWRRAAIASYSAGRSAGVRLALAWRGTLSDMGMVVVSSTLAVGGISHALDGDAMQTGDGGDALTRSFPRFADDLARWTQAARAQRSIVPPPF